jgi:hypothetical protein
LKAIQGKLLKFMITLKTKDNISMTHIKILLTSICTNKPL